MVRFLVGIGQRGDKPIIPRESARNDITRPGGFAPGEPPRLRSESRLQSPNAVLEFDDAVANAVSIAERIGL